MMLKIFGQVPVVTYCQFELESENIQVTRRVFSYENHEHLTYQLSVLTAKQGQFPQTYVAPYYLIQFQ